MPGPASIPGAMPVPEPASTPVPVPVPVLVPIPAHIPVPLPSPVPAQVPAPMPVHMLSPTLNPFLWLSPLPCLYSHPCRSPEAWDCLWGFRWIGTPGEAPLGGFCHTAPATDSVSRPTWWPPDMASKDCNSCHGLHFASWFRISQTALRSCAGACLRIPS